MSTLELGLIGNCAVAALVDRQAKIVWWCLPRFDGDPVFHALLGQTSGDPHDGAFTIDVEGGQATSQTYVENTAILKTIFESDEGSVEITDFAPRFEAKGRMFRPRAIVRRIRPLSGRPRVKVRIRPRFEYGNTKGAFTSGSNHLRYVGADEVVRVTTNAPVSYIREERTFILDRPLAFFIGPDESLTDHPDVLCRTFEENTQEYWRRWSRRLALPLDYQEATIRAAITLKMCVLEETGAIIAAVTTSVPEAAGTERNWDYRYCWIRDAFFVVRALNALSEVETMENYLLYLNNIVARADGGHIQPVYGIALEETLTETFADLPGYRGNGPVRVGNQAYEHYQHDVYGQVILAAAQAFVDKRLFSQTDDDYFAAMERVGERAFELHNKSDAGIWELRTRERVHTSSSLMCWAACDRLAKIAARRDYDNKAGYWRAKAEIIHKTICDEAWNEELQSFVESFGGSDMDASLLLMAEVGFLPAQDPRFISTVERIGEKLRKGNHLLRYHAADDFGDPENAFNICTFWYIDALARIGRTDEARDIYETMLAARNHLGLLSEDTNIETGELWGNFPQTYSMVGIINGAVRLSARWDSVV